MYEIFSRSISRALYSALTFALVASLLLPPVAASAATNLVPNPTFANGSSGTPTGWGRGHWGDNAATFTYPADGFDGNPGARVDITSYMSGDSKWYFTPLSVSANTTYSFSDHYKSTATSYVTVEFTAADGTRTYRDIGTLPPASSFTAFSGSFITPPNTAKATVFHLIKSVGSLTVDTYDLHAAPAPTPGTIPNPSLEMSVSGTAPDSWHQGRWGSSSPTFTYPVAGHTGAKAARVDMNNWVSGDAKWYFDDVPVQAGAAYRFTDYYRSSAKTYVTVQFKHSSGALTYQDIGELPASEDWTQFTGDISVPAGVVSITVFHLIKENGWLEVDDYTMAPLASDPTKFDHGYISLNFDDGWRSAYENAFPVLDAAGFTADAYIVTEHMSDYFPGYMSEEEVLDLQARGYTIGAHTLTHPDLTTLSRSRAKTEIEKSKQDLLDMGVSSVTTFAYPFGAYNDRVKQMVKDAGFIAGRSSDGGWNTRESDKYALRRLRIVNTTTLDEVKAYVEKAMRDRSWGILLFHEVNNSGNTYSVTPEFLKQVVEYLEQQNITPITVEEGVAKMAP